MIGKIYSFFERGKTSEEKKLHKEICSFLDPYLVFEQKCTLLLFSILFGIYILVYGIYSPYLYVFGALMGVLIIWPFVVMKVPNIIFREASFKVLTAGIFTYSSCISGGIFSPVFAWVFFLSMDMMPHPYMLKNSHKDQTGVICGLIMFATVSFIHFSGRLPHSILPFDQQAIGTLIVLMGGFGKMIVIDRMNRVPVTDLHHKLRQNYERNVELEKARDAAIELSQTKSIFLTQMSHELRTPLNAIIGFSEIMKMEMLGEMKPEYKHYADDIYKSGQHLLSIMTKIMDMAKLENGQYKLDIQDFNPLDTVLCIKALLQEALEQKNMTLIIDCYSGSNLLESDEQAIIQILEHIVGNATEHCPDGATIHVAILCEKKEGMRFIVSDNGTGFSQKILKNFGMPFNIDVDPLHDNSATTGLGLSIAKKIVTMLEGDMRAENNMDGGASVIITIPHYNDAVASDQNKMLKNLDWH